MNHRLLPLLSSILLGAAGGGSHAQWNGNGPVWTNDSVGIGDSTPGYRLHVVENSALVALRSEAGLNSGTAIWGQALGTGGLGVFGGAAASSGNSIGVQGWVASPTGKALFGYASSGRGTNYAVYGQTQSASGYSGYFTGGKFYAGGGFVGIGRTTPINSTEVIGAYRNSSSWGGMYMGTNTGGKPYYGYAAGGVARAWHHYDDSSGQWHLYVGGYRMTVNNGNGRVGIGTTSPSYQLHVNGTAGKPGGGSWSNASDRRLKKNVEPLDGALERLLSVRGVSYEYLDPHAIQELPGPQIGVIAQEVERSFPTWVDEGDDGYKRVTFRGFEGVAIEALRELDQQNEGLRTELAAVRENNALLAEELAGMKARFERLEQALAATPGSPGIVGGP